MENKEKEARRFVSIPVTPDEYDAITALVVDMTAAKRVPVTRVEVIRQGINKVAKEIQGRAIFQPKQQG